MNSYREKDKSVQKFFQIFTNLVVVLQHLSDDSDLGMVVFDGYHSESQKWTRFLI